jgi:glycosyltransferase involved in cell wall biosynthesis
MRILYYSTAAGQSHGGAVHTEELVTALQALGHQVRVFPPPDARRRRMPRPRSRRWLTLRFLYRNLRLVRRAVRAIRSYRPDAVLVRLDNNPLQLPMLRAAGRVPVVTEVNSWPFDESYRDIPLPRLWHVVSRLALLKGSDGAFFVTANLRNLVVGDSARPTDRVIPNGVRVEPYRHGDRPTGGRGRTFGYVGYLDIHKHVPDMITAFEEVAAGNPDLRLRIAGDGPAAAELERRIGVSPVADQIELVGYVAHDQVPEFLSTLDVGVHHHARDYMCPLKLFEYAAAGLAIIAPDTRGVREVFRPDLHVVAVDGSPPSIAEAMAKLAEDEDLRRRLATAARHHVTEHHTWSHSARAVTDLLATAAGRSQREPGGDASPGPVRRWLVEAPPGTPIVVSGDRRCLRTVVQAPHLTAVGAAPTLRAALRTLRRSGITVNETLAVWPSVRQPRVIAPYSARNTWRWARRAGLLGGGRTLLVQWLLRSPIGSLLTRWLTAGVVLVGEKGGEDDCREDGENRKGTVALARVAHPTTAHLVDLGVLGPWLVENWSAWTGKDGPWTAMVPPSRGRGRRTILLFARGSTQPDLVVKVSTDATQQSMLMQEAQALRALHGHPEAAARLRIPRALGAIELPVGHRAAIAIEALAGRRLPPIEVTSRATWIQERRLVRYLQCVSDFSTALAAVEPADVDAGHHAQQVLARFASIADDPSVARAATAFGEVVASSRPCWGHGWQHADVNHGNILIDGDGVMFVDWESARPDLPVWFDLAMVPLSFVRRAAIRRGGPVTADTVVDVLGTDQPFGRMVERAMSQHWTHQVPLSWAITLTAAHLALDSTPHGGQPNRTFATVVASLLTDGPCRRRAAWAAPTL